MRDQASRGLLCYMFQDSKPCGTFALPEVVAMAHSHCPRRGVHLKCCTLQDPAQLQRASDLDGDFSGIACLSVRLFSRLARELPEFLRLTNFPFLREQVPEKPFNWSGIIQTKRNEHVDHHLF